MYKRKASPVGWARTGLPGLLLSRLFKVPSPTILVLSLPRSGSSWVGEILGSASNALYLREPMTQSHLAWDDKEITEVFIDPNAALKGYERYADAAFSGFPMFSRNIVRKPDQWSLFARHSRRLVIKEVNLLACEWLLKKYSPRVIFIVRHPVDVALSYKKLGWTNINLEKVLLSQQPLMEGYLKPWERHLMSIGLSFLERHGAMQGAILRYVFDILKGYSDHTVVLYEELCADPLGTFRHLFDFANLLWDDEITRLIRERSSGGDSTQPYSISRNSYDMIHAWKGKVSNEEANSIKNSYGAFNLPWYQSPGCWV